MSSSMLANEPGLAPDAGLRVDISEGLWICELGQEYILVLVTS